MGVGATYNSVFLMPDRWETWGLRAIHAGFALALISLMGIAWIAPAVALWVPLVLIVGITGWYLFQYPLANLFVLLAGFVVISGTEPGIQIEEVLYGLYLVAFLGHWFVTQVYLGDVKLVNTAADWAMLLFIIWSLSTLLQSILFGVKPAAYFGELSAFLTWFLYFPMRATMEDHGKKGLKVILAAFLAITLIVALRNLFNYRQIIASATYAWQIAKGRVHTNEMFLLFGSLGCMIGSFYLVEFRKRLLSVIGFTIFLASLILTQSRGYWIDFIVAAALFFFLIDSRRRVRFVQLGTSLAILFALAALLLLGDALPLVISGLTERLVSLATASSTDISLVNRFVEAGAVWDAIAQNPVIGYGMGVPFLRLDIIQDFHELTVYAHNGWLAVWFKLGIPGLFLLAYLWGSTLVHGLKAWRSRSHATWMRFTGLGVALGLVSALPSSFTSNPFTSADMIILLCFLFAAGSAIVSMAAEKNEINRSKRTEHG